MENTFCTCEKHDCKLNPKNHDQGCDPCMRKNLKQGEVPSCLFRMVNEDLSGVERFDVKGFVAHYNSSQKNSRQ